MPEEELAEMRRFMLNEARRTLAVERLLIADLAMRAAATEKPLGFIEKLRNAALETIEPGQAGSLSEPARNELERVLGLVERFAL